METMITPKRKNFVNRNSLALFALVAVLIGCGGGGQNIASEVSGIITDDAGNNIRDAHVYFDQPGKHETFSNSNGTYVLTDIPIGERLIRAEARTTNNQRYYGQNMAKVVEGERSKTVNIVLIPENQVRSFSGFVYDRQGRSIEGARVVARQRDGIVLSASYAITDRDGRYALGGLRLGTNYDVVVNARGYGTITDFLTPGTDPSDQSFTLGNPTNPNLPAPTTLVATAYTSPFVASRSAKSREALETIKRLIRPASANKTRLKGTSTSRMTLAGNWVEIDLTWDRVTQNDLLGYGIYRSTGGAYSPIAFFRDPLGELFADVDASLQENQTYSYTATALNTSFDDISGSGESAFSNTSTVTTLDGITVLTPSFGPLTFRWQPLTGATQYSMYLFDNFPTINEPVRFSNYSSPVTTTSFVYPGPTLISGRRYYYVILGRGPQDEAISVSDVQDFVAP